LRFNGQFGFFQTPRQSIPGVEIGFLFFTLTFYLAALGGIIALEELFEKVAVRKELLSTVFSFLISASNKF